MLDFSIELAKKAGRYLEENFCKDLRIEYKGRIDPVTQVDRESQDIILSAIDKSFPDHSIIAEEGGMKDTGKEYTWYIDPLDGTVNYVHGIPIFCVSIALYKGMKPYIGVCFNPMNNELFFAESGKGAFMNGEKISVSPVSKLINSLVVTGFPYSIEMLDETLVRFRRILSHVQGIRRLGSAALDLCYVAKGSFEGFWEVGLKPWDIAAGALIVLEAGGAITGVDGLPFDLSTGNILASNLNIHDGLKKLM